MVPSVQLLPNLPLSASGKVDRRALLEMSLEASSESKGRRGEAAVDLGMVHG